jgi:REP element-mobilizing transposase RayT
MGNRRIKVEGATAVYHCMSRVVAGERLLDAGAKEVLRKMLWKTAAFCGVEILSYCIMTNHFHVLVRVAAGEVAPLERAELLKRYRAFYESGPKVAGYPTPAVLEMYFADGGERADHWEARLRARMGDVSEFMKTLKHRFAVWYNRSRNRFGAFWAERFKSVLVENAPFALQTVAAYIDLNPVRAGLVANPADYRWSSFGEAMAGQESAGRGLAQVVDAFSWSEARESYRLLLFGKGAVARKEGDKSLGESVVKHVQDRQGEPDVGEILRCRVRYFTQGAILGSQEFVRVQGEALFASKSKTRTSPNQRKRLGNVLAEASDASESPLMAWRYLRQSSTR